MNALNNLRYFSNLYFHGHSVGGTNPSLLEAMASSALIVAHNNQFNKAILETEAFYFSTAGDIAEVINSPLNREKQSKWVNDNREKISKLYSWEVIIQAYENLFLKLAETKAN